ncbi:MAG TPA: phosphonopyruvate decarboxylase [Actinocrinis sp.]|nr:phosphonopyruvate decarboxylase [Actinocrinis sp.]
MIDAGHLMGELVDRGVSLVSGVPCSYLTPVINRAISDPRVRYLGATQEGEAAAVAAGAWLGGGLGCVIGQNSGLGNMINPLTSLLHPARIPALVLVTWRGEPGRPDEPQHELMGRTTTALLDVVEVPWELMPQDPDSLPGVLDRAWQQMAKTGRPAALVISKDTVQPEPLDEPGLGLDPAVVVRSSGRPERPARADVLRALLDAVPPHAAIISTTGFTSRELYTLDDRDQHFYVVGAMGSAASIGLGVSTQTPRPVLVVDGDGALLMRLGSLATVGAHQPDRLVHLVLDNGQHESTGGQRTVSEGVDFAGVAAACGYRQVYTAADTEELIGLLGSALAGGGPTLIHLPIRPGSMAGLGRPTVTPAEVAERFRAFTAAPVAEPAPALSGEAVS